jgi:hypothetical protein
MEIVIGLVFLLFGLSATAVGLLVIRSVFRKLRTWETTHARHFLFPSLAAVPNGSQPPGHGLGGWPERPVNGPHRLALGKFAF